MTRRQHTAAVRLFITCAALTASSAPTGLFAQATTLRPGRTIAGTLGAGDTARYTFQAGANTFVFGEVDQISVDVAIRALNADGEQIARTDAIGRGGERFAGEMENAGVYTLEVIPVDDETGDYTITLHRLEPVAKDPKKLADQVMARFDGDSPGAAVQVWREGRTLFSKTYGMANLAYSIPFEPDTRTNIGSTSKQFTAFAILLQAERGLLSLDDDIRTHIPELPGFDHVVTVRHLITHTSGLREFLNLLRMSGRRLDHGDWIDRSELISIVQRQPALQNEPGSEFNYNNTAFGLAALIVERTSDMAFHDFMRVNVFEPLGMTRTMVRPSPEHIVPEASEGYTPGEYGFRQIGDLGGATGAGGIYTTIGDLQKWAQNYASPTVGSRAIVEQMMTPNVLTTGDTTGYGFGVFIDEQRGLKRVQHGGADVSHRSMLAIYPEINAGITVQSNHAQFGSSTAFRLAEAFFEDAMEPELDPVTETAATIGDFDPESYDPADFDEFVGRYALDPQPDFILTFTRAGDTLFTQATGQRRLRIVPTSDSSFALIDVEASVTFHRNEDGEVDGLTLNQNGQAHATRLSDEGTAEWDPSAAELAAFEGRYFSEEIETFYTLTVEEDQLVMHHIRLDDAEMEPGERDMFSGGGFTFSFERDRNGRVVAFYLANGRTRNVRFERIR
jgi:CubicO group peptidase (beta-lactamase class C family)